jgi:hypothetical protein
MGAIPLTHRPCGDISDPNHNSTSFKYQKMKPKENILKEVREGASLQRGS